MADISVPRFNFNQTLVDERGYATQPFRVFLNQVQRYLPIIGEGSPEGAVAATQYSLYVDTTGPTEYRKIQPEIGGDTTLGWQAT